MDQQPDYSCASCEYFLALGGSKICNALLSPTDNPNTSNECPEWIELSHEQRYKRNQELEARVEHRLQTRVELPVHNRAIVIGMRLCADDPVPVWFTHGSRTAAWDCTNELIARREDEESDPEQYYRLSLDQFGARRRNQCQYLRRDLPKKACSGYD